MKDKVFYILLEIKRVNWLKNIDLFVTELVNIYAYDNKTGSMNTEVYGVGNTVGDRIYVKIMKGTTTMVTIKDLYKSLENQIKDTNNYIPVVLGIDIEGNPIMYDFKKLDSILVTGMTRSGKTWFVIAVMAQMMSFLKPSELNFYIYDPKALISDLSFLSVPHIKRFVSEDTAILEDLRRVVNIEGDRRAKLFGEAGVTHIWDFKRKNPNVDMPLIYIVIDEVITLAERMEESIKKEFQSLLLQLVSRLPALGIRVIMIPHVVKDAILKKTMTDLIPCRVSVKGSLDHIVSTLGVKKFDHKLRHVGDMAIKLDNSEAKFMHSVVLSDSNDGNVEFFDFLEKFWLKIEPESIKGSLLEKAKMKGVPVIDINNNLSQNNYSNKIKPKVGKNGGVDFNDLLDSINK
ncbi:DNA translocase SftA [compost metagenome]